MTAALIKAVRLLGSGAFLLAIAASASHAQIYDRGESGIPPRIIWGGYLDIGYLDSSTRPSNHGWRTKSTTSVLDRLRINNASVALQRGPSLDSPWGYQVGLQAGIDIDGLVPAEEVAVGAAKPLSHLFAASVSYWFRAGRGIGLTGGLLPGFPGYPSFLAGGNPSYTRPYQVDMVPYFLWGLRASYPASGPLVGSLYVVTGWNYLEWPNDVLSTGLQLVWEAADGLQLTQNIYYGPDQAATDLEYWRFASNTIAEWTGSRFLLAGSVHYMSEKQAAVAGNPGYQWAAGALWLQWLPTANWRFAVRPEVIWDSDGLATGNRQTLTALALTAEYRLTPVRLNTLSARAELRLDRSTGEEGGFYMGPDNALVPDQRLFILAVMWRFRSDGQ